jgi:oxygen-dependent protoporphyrinogen oxidase
LLVRCYVGGVGREAILQLDGQALVARVREELASMCGVTANPGYVEVNRWMKAMPQYTLGHLDRLNQIEGALSRYGGLVLTGAGYRGVGIPDCIRDGAVAADRVVRYLSGERSS